MLSRIDLRSQMLSEVVGDLLILVGKPGAMDMLQEKEDFLNEAAANSYTLFFQHDLYNECATVHQAERGVRVKETFTL